MGMSRPGARFGKPITKSRWIATRLRTEILEPRCCLSHWGTPLVPAFSSLPGANHTIYLDFDGQVVENTSWNSYYNQATLDAPPFDIDGNPGVFSATELARIEEAWKRTAEDFLPFNVNVTTVDPGIEALRKSGTGDAQWGVRAVVTKESSFVTNSTEYCGCGGIAYIDSFNWNTDTPVWVYTTGAKSIAEAASHEVGHSLGLSHDGTASVGYYEGHGSGTTGWAPIMGVGYYQNVSQWDKGEYYGSNNAGTGANYGKGPDDLAIITSYNGFSYRADDHGNTSGASSALATSGTSVSATGIIERNTDVDVFRFTTGAGPVSLNVNPFALGPNLDIKADLYDAAGALVASANSSSVLNATISLSLAAGQYFLHVDGAGWGTPGATTPSGYSDYASLGRYDITGSIVDPGIAPSLSIGDASVNEAAGVATFTVTLSSPAASPVTVNYATANGSASAGSDYTTTGGTLTFNPGGPLSQSITVPILDDASAEGSETFFVNLSGASGAALSDGQGQGTIADNDASLSIGDTSGTEGNTVKKTGAPQLKSFVFTISLSGAVGHAVSVNYSTQDGTATTANNDYQAAAGSVTFAPGETSKTVSVTVVGDKTVEANETFSVVLSGNSGAGIADGTGVGTINNDDSTGGGGGGGPRNGAITAREDDMEWDASQPIVEELWYFEEPSADTAIGHNHRHDLGHPTGSLAGMADLLAADHHEGEAPGQAAVDATLALWPASNIRDVLRDGQAASSRRLTRGSEFTSGSAFAPRPSWLATRPLVEPSSVAAENPGDDFGADSSADADLADDCDSDGRAGDRLAGAAG